MAKYADASDCIDPLLQVSELNLLEADVFVDLALSTMGITPQLAATIRLPNAILTAIASAWAKRLAAIEGAMGDSSVLMDKATQYQQNAEGLVLRLNRTVLGVEDPDSGIFGGFPIFRS